MASHKLNISELDFDNIKANLKRFLSNQNQFKDYDFEGSGMAVLLDLLAYNTHYLSYHTNVAVNEMFIDSADLRNSIVSLAKALGYTPSSATASYADINVRVNDGTGGSITMPVGTKFTTTVDGTSYSFVTAANHTIAPIDGVYEFKNIKIYEGTYVTFNYTENSSDVDQRFIIPSANADTTTLTVEVQNSSTDTVIQTYNRATSITELDGDSKVYFLQEAEDGKFEVYFGDGIIGKKLDDGNIVRLKYVVTNKDAANGASTFTLASNIQGFNDFTLTVNSNAANGADAETDASVKFHAPKFYASQDRAVTVEDYKVKVNQLYPNAHSISAWGGEDNDTPYYGKVFISIKPKSGSNLTLTTKRDIVNTLKRYSVASVRPEIIDPEITKIILTSTIKYDDRSTTKSADDIKTDVISSLESFNDNTLQMFDSMFRYSKLTETIDDTDNSILSNITKVKIRKSFTPSLDTSINYNVSFSNAFYNPHTGHASDLGGVLLSSGFKVSNSNEVMYLDDDGNGNIRRFYNSTSTTGLKVYVDNNAGTINYQTGEIIINALVITSVENIRGSASTSIELTVQPQSNDIVPLRNQIIELDVANSSINVEVDTFVGGSANAGVGYSTTSSYN
jgi:uncharacterized glyoxalase superfamily protein PhnB